MANRIQKISIEKIAKEKLPKQIINDIDSIEVVVWENIESGLSLKVDRKSIDLRINYKISTNKFLASFGSIIAAIAGVIAILKWLTPIFIAYFATSPP